jgi:hypothetical protein
MGSLGRCLTLESVVADVVARNLTAIAAPGCDGHHGMVVSGSANPGILTAVGRRLKYLTKW